ncbi:hypothetical protein [Roseateles sp. P5_E7]
MWEQDWALLGIEPTTELGAIKKAYALKLRVTRPDDDAEAYQALRGAYERAQQWVKLQEAQPAEAASTELVAPEAALAAEVVDAADDEQPPTPDSAEHAVRRLHALWRQQGTPALLAEWPAVHSMLDAQPLAERAEWSEYFAHWVVEQDDLPDTFVDALNGYFDWQQDFRAERQIGKKLAEAVRQALRDRQSRQRAQDIQRAVRDRHPPPEPPRPPEPPSEALKEQVRPLRELDELRFGGAQALWLALLLRPKLARLLYSLDQRTLEQCGIDPLMRSSLDRQLARARLLRAGVLSGLVLVLFLLKPDEADTATVRMIMWCMGVISWLSVSHLLGAVMHQGLSPEVPDGPAQRWRRHPRQPAAGLGLIAVAAAVAACGQYWDLTTLALPIPAHTAGLLQTLLDAAPWIVLWVGTTLAWPLHPIVSPACVGLLVPVAGLLFGCASPVAPWASVMAIALLYVLLGAARFEGRLGGNIVLDNVCRPITHTLMMAMRWGWVFALLPSLLTLAYLLSSRPPPSVPSLMLACVLLTLALQQLQHRIEPWALERLSRA